VIKGDNIMVYQRLFLFVGQLLAGITLAMLVFSAGCEKAVVVPQERSVIEVPEPVSPLFIQGQEWGTRYLNKAVNDYDVVLALYLLDSEGRAFFLDGFGEVYTTAGKETQGKTYCKVLDESVSGNQYETAKERGRKHARQAITNEQIQGVIQSSLGVSKGVALGWKAGYIKGFSAQRIALRAAGGSLDEKLMQAAYEEAASTYYALRAAAGQ
jgi:hypothetical protein